MTDSLQSSRAGPAADNSQKSGASRKQITQALSAWGGISVVIGLAADLLSPLGNFSVWLLILAGLVFIVSAAGLFMDSLRNRARFVMAFSGLGVVVFGSVVALQHLATPEQTGGEQGFVASNISPVARLQTAVLPISETKKELLRFSTDLQTADPVERRVMAREAMNTEDGFLRRVMLERLLATGDPALRQVAVATALENRINQPIPFQLLDDGPSENDNGLWKALMGQSLEVQKVSIDSGAFSGRIYTSGVSGTAGRDGIRMNGHAAGYSAPVTFDLSIQDDLTVRGTARTSNESYEIALALF